MQCLMTRSMLVCMGLSLSSCATASLPIDDFCQIYNPVIQQKGDGTISATSGVKKRILANELTYRDQCSKK
jgi:hypothetical protein